ncbi:MAG: hypothetical protein PVF59_04425 [Desulfobacterales bacterium]|jgi:hypothetical protein
MLTKNDIIGSVLIRELIAIRTDTLWRMLARLRKGQLPGIHEEGATGKLDNKGAIFIPGGLICQDVDEQEIAYKPMAWNESLFRRKIRESLQFDNATLLFPDGLVKSVNLDSGFFTRAARRIYTFKTAAFKRKRRLGKKPEIEVEAVDIIRSHCPTYIDPPYGSRTRISTCVSIGLTAPHMYFAYWKTEFNLSRRRLENFTHRLDAVHARKHLPSGKSLYHPHVVVCHDTRYKENSLTGLIRILGIGRFGEFSTLTFEQLSAQLSGELKRKHIDCGAEHVFAEYGGVKAVCVLRTYAPTNPGKRSPKYRLDLISHQKDVSIDLDRIAQVARKRYQIEI